MGINLSKIPITVFEILNEICIAVGAGIPGLFILMNQGIANNRAIATTMISSLTLACWMYAFNTHEMSQSDKYKIIVITGCDTGLGYSLAQHARSMGFTVLAGCFNVLSDGAVQLAEVSNVHVFDLDITNMESVQKAVTFTNQMLNENPNNVLWAVINNAGVMVFGEFEWQTERIIQQQLGINLMGTMRFTNAFCPLLRYYNARLINISSHCALQTLPGLSVYGATKAGIQGFNDAIRVELTKYGVSVISFIPGSFAMQSNIMAKQMDYAHEMRSAFTKEQDAFYSTYFIKYNAYLRAISSPKLVRKIHNPYLYEEFEHALLSKTPKAMYKVEPWRYYVYHTLFKISPVVIRDFLVERFVQMPSYEPAHPMILN